MPDDKPRIIFGSEQFGNSLFLSPKIADKSAAASKEKSICTQNEAYNFKLLYSECPKLNEIEELIGKAENQFAQAKISPASKAAVEPELQDTVYMQARFFLLLARKDLLSAQSFLLIKLTQKQHFLHTEVIKPYAELPKEKEFQLFEHTQQLLTGINNMFIQLTLDIIETCIKRELYCIADNYFAELQLFGDTDLFRDRIENLRKIVSHGRKTG
ncbi:MAG: hypothetical protein PHV30_07270 [Candidatus Margulisbacteria bacterium]|nr:hypothetical protein [Candidatus Margulisiibacteriota bacterium]